MPLSIFLSLQLMTIVGISLSQHASLIQSIAPQSLLKTRNRLQFNPFITSDTYLEWGWWNEARSENGKRNIQNRLQLSNLRALLFFVSSKLRNRVGLPIIVKADDTVNTRNCYSRTCYCCSCKEFHRESHINSLSLNTIMNKQVNKWLRNVNKNTNCMISTSSNNPWLMINKENRKIPDLDGNQYPEHLNHS